MRHWHVHVLCKLALRSPIESANSEAICVPIKIKHVHSSMPYQQAIHPKYDRRGHESPSGYGPLSLYSTAKFLGSRPTRWDTNMLVSKNAKICVTPNANPQCEQVEYRWRWVPNANFSRWPCTFHVFCVDFICVG